MFLQTQLIFQFIDNSNQHLLFLISFAPEIFTVYFFLNLRSTDEQARVVIHVLIEKHFCSIMVSNSTLLDSFCSNSCYRISKSSIFLTILVLQSTTTDLITSNSIKMLRFVLFFMLFVNLLFLNNCYKSDFGEKISDGSQGRHFLYPEFTIYQVSCQVL